VIKRTGKKSEAKAETVCGLVVYVPKSYRIPTFLEELEARVAADGSVALECKVIGVPTPALLWYKDGKELNSGDSYELRAENLKPTTVYKWEKLTLFLVYSFCQVRRRQLRGIRGLGDRLEDYQQREHLGTQDNRGIDQLEAKNRH